VEESCDMAVGQAGNGDAERLYVRGVGRLGLR